MFSMFMCSCIRKIIVKTPCCLFHLVHDPQLILARFDKTDKKDTLY